MYQIHSNFPLNGGADTAIGGRPENQDDWGFCDTPIGCLVIVCDGMGGGPGGKTASFIAKTVFMQTVINSSPEQEPVSVLQQATANANAAIFQKMQEMPELAGMGSTFVAILFNADAAYVVHCGDSRCYKLRWQRKVFRTADHSLVGELVRSRALTEEQARTSPQSNIVTRTLGSKGNAVPDIDIVPFEKGDRFILCTDGVWGIMPEKELVKRFVAKKPIANICDDLQAEIDILGPKEKDSHHDNHTLAIIDVDVDSKLKEKMNRKTLYIIVGLACALVVSLLLNIILAVSGVGSKDDNATIATPQASNDSQIAANVQGNSDDSAPTITLEDLQKARAEVEKAAKEAEEAEQKRIAAEKAELEKAAPEKKQEVEKKQKEQRAEQTKENNKAKSTVGRKIRFLLAGMRDHKGKKLKEASKFMEDSFKDISAQMKELAKVSSKEALELDKCVNETAESGQPLVVLVHEKDGKYVSTDVAKKQIQKALDIVNSIPGVK